MFARRASALALTLIAGISLAAAPPAPIHVQISTWSRAGRPLPYSVHPDPALLNARIPSPNGKFEIACNGVAGYETVGAGESVKIEAPNCVFMGRGTAVPIDLKVGPEALWAPDSAAVAITQSGGGAIGPYQVLIYRPDQPHATDIAHQVRQDLARRYPACVGAAAGCDAAQRRQMRRDTSWVNVAAIRWMENSSRLLVMAWVPDSSGFGANLGRRQGYIIDVRTGKILTRYSQAEFTRRFKKDCGDWGL